MDELENDKKKKVISEEKKAYDKYENGKYEED